MDTRTRGSEIDIKFIESRSRYGPEGDPRAMRDFVYQVNDSDVIVTVHTGAVRTLDDDQLSKEEVKLAAKTLVELEIEQKRISSPKVHLTLDKDVMISVVDRLGWRSRFRRDI